MNNKDHIVGQLTNCLQSLYAVINTNIFIQIYQNFCLRTQHLRFEASLTQMHIHNFMSVESGEGFKLFLIITKHRADPLDWQQHAIELEAHFPQPLETPSPLTLPPP